MKRVRILGIFFLVFCICFDGGNLTSLVCQQGEVQAKSNKKKNKKSGKHLWEYRRNFNNRFSMQDEVKIGDYYMGKQIEVLRKKKIGVDLKKHLAIRRRMQTIVNRLGKVSDHPELPYEVHVFDIPKVVNAYCLPGGKIGVYSGLWDSKQGLINVKSDDELASILAHEMAHANLRHATRRITTSQTLGIIGGIASIAIGQAGSVAQSAFDVFFNLGTTFMIPSYSRKHEKEADRTGFYYMSKAHYNPDAAIAVWERAAASKGKGNKRNVFSSHPSNGARAKYLRTWLEEAHLISKGELTVP